jgi:hypothetical protein
MEILQEIDQQGWNQDELSAPPRFLSLLPLTLFDHPVVSLRQSILVRGSLESSPEREKRKKKRVTLFPSCFLPSNMEHQLAFHVNQSIGS